MGCWYLVASPAQGTGKPTDLKQKDDALPLAARDAPWYLSKLRLSVFRGNRADGAVVKTTVPSYIIKCPSVRKMTRNEEFFVSLIHVELILFFNFFSWAWVFALYVATSDYSSRHIACSWYQPPIHLLLSCHYHTLRALHSILLDLL